MPQQLEKVSPLGLNAAASGYDSRRVINRQGTLRRVSNLSNGAFKDCGQITGYTEVTLHLDRLLGQPLVWRQPDRSRVNERFALKSSIEVRSSASRHSGKFAAERQCGVSDFLPLLGAAAESRRKETTECDAEQRVRGVGTLISAQLPYCKPCAPYLFMNSLTNSAISSALVSKAKWPASKTWTSAFGTSFR